MSATLLAVGDIGPLRDDAEVLFDPTRKLLQAADITFGQLEKCLSDRGTQQLYLNKSLARAAPRVAGCDRRGRVRRRVVRVQPHAVLQQRRVCSTRSTTSPATA